GLIKESRRGEKRPSPPAGTVLAFQKEVRSAAPAAAKVQILVSQNFYRHGDRFREENGERFDKFITNEFVVHTVYGCQVVVTNPSPSKQRLAVGYLVAPRGPVQGARTESRISPQGNPIAHPASRRRGKDPRLSVHLRPPP